MKIYYLNSSTFAPSCIQVKEVAKMPSIPVFLSSGTERSTEKTPLLQKRTNGKAGRPRHYSSPPLGFQPPTEVADSLAGIVSPLSRVPTAANLTTIHETDENEDFDSSTVIINTPRSGTLRPWVYYSLGSYRGRMRGQKQKVLLWTSFLLSGIFLTVLFVSMPMYLQSGFTVGSDGYVAMVTSSIWFPVGFFALLFITKWFIRTVPLLPNFGLAKLIVGGMLLGMSHLGLAISCLPAKTPPAFQAMQLTLAFPVWKGTKAVMENKCKILCIHSVLRASKMPIAQPHLLSYLLQREQLLVRCRKLTGRGVEQKCMDGAKSFLFSHSIIRLLLDGVSVPVIIIMVVAWWWCCH